MTITSYVLVRRRSTVSASITMEGIVPASLKHGKKTEMPRSVRGAGGGAARAARSFAPSAGKARIDASPSDGTVPWESVTVTLPGIEGVPQRLPQLARLQLLLHALLRRHLGAHHRAHHRLQVRRREPVYLTQERLPEA